jgi:hypothetical protein
MEPSLIHRYARALEDPSTTRPPQATERDWSILTRYRAGTTMKQMAQEHGTTSTTIRTWRIKAENALRAQIAPRYTRVGFNPAGLTLGREWLEIPTPSGYLRDWDEYAVRIRLDQPATYTGEPRGWEHPDRDPNWRLHLDVSVYADFVWIEPATEQPRPADRPAGDTTPDVQTRLIRMIEDRRQHGIETYGQALYPFNGRDSDRDALEEALDLTLYLLQRQEERREEQAQLAAVRAFASDLIAGQLDAETPITEGGRDFARLIGRTLETLTTPDGR